MGDIAVIQPVLLAVEIAFGELWRSLGVEPDAVVGHSMGEAGAAYFAGAISLEDAMAVICCRSALMRKTSGRGAMAVVELGFQELKARLTSFESQVTVAVSNAPRSSVMSGDPAVIKQILAQLEGDGIFARPVKVDVASHSPQMDPLVPELIGALSGVRPRTAAVDLYSTVFARKISGAEMDAGYWGRNLRQPVLFGATVEALIAAGIDTFIELSPHPLLLGAVAQVSQSLQRPVLALQSTRRQEPERQTLLASLGALFVAGHPVQWQRLYPAVRRVDLPKYPWQRERCGADCRNIFAPRGAMAASRPLQCPRTSCGYRTGRVCFSVPPVG
jgi:acyl transferase domain-containing protein